MLFPPYTHASASMAVIDPHEKKRTHHGLAGWPVPSLLSLRYFAETEYHSSKSPVSYNIEVVGARR